MIESNSKVPMRKVLILDSHNGNNSIIENWFLSQEGFEIFGVYTSPFSALSACEEGLPDLLLVGIDMPNGIRFCQIIRKKKPNITILGIASQPKEQLEVLLKQSGAQDAISRGAETQIIAQKVQNILSVEGRSMCSIVAVAGIKQGVGTTLLTCILGDVLGKRYPGKVLLIDLSPSRGDLAFNFGITSALNIQDLLNKNEFLSPRVFSSYMIGNLRGCCVLPCSQDLEIKAIDESALTALLSVLGNFFEVIVMDFPPYPFIGLEGIIDFCDTVFINIGQTSNQIKLAYQMVSYDLKRLPESFVSKICPVSWCEDLGSRTGISGLMPQTIFLPRPKEAMFSNPKYTIDGSSGTAPLFEGINTLLDKVPLSPFQQAKKPAPQSIWKYLRSWLKT